jgi:3-hydroxyisobutyrate dehydrogenase
LKTGSWGCVLGRCVGIVGAGLMGSSIAKCLVSRGFNVVVYNRTREKAERLCGDIGCSAVGKPAELEGCEYIIVFVFDDEAVLDVVLGKDGLAYMSPSSDVYILNSSTISPETSLRVYRFLRGIDKRIYYLESPVYGSVDEAENCSLVSMIAGDEDDVKHVMGFVKEYSAWVIRVGEIPKAMALKLALNNIGLSIPPILAESLALLEAYNVDLEIFKTVSEKLWFGKFIERYLGRIIGGGRVRFTVKGAAKDYKIISNTLSTNMYSSIVSSAIKNFYTLASRKYGGEDYPRALLNILKGEILKK